MISGLRHPYDDWEVDREEAQADEKDSPERARP